MRIFSFRTIAQAATGTYKEKGSKFLAFAYPVDNEEMIRHHLDHLRKAYFDARHHCFAWVLGPERTLFRAYDDGEPNHSAGDPILGQLRSRQLTDVLVVVVRYFGGTKLGVGGLINAYKTAAADALEHVVIVEREVVGSLSIVYNYSSSAEVMKMVNDFNLKVIHQSFDAACTLRVAFGVRHEAALRERVERLKALGHITETGE